MNEDETNGAFGRALFAVTAALVVMVILAYIIMPTEEPDDIYGLGFPSPVTCDICHHNLNATENATPCAECKRAMNTIWSNAYT